MRHGSNQPVVLCHDPESFFEGCFLIPGSHSLLQIVDDCQVSIVQNTCFLHDADAPVEICRKAILQIVWLYERVAGEECLMADYIPCLKLFQVSVSGADNLRIRRKCLSLSTIAVSP